jgi:hypothetical protein
MPGNKFLNPLLKTVLCIVGMVVLAYHMSPSIMSGNLDDRMTLLRLVVFLGFTYLLVQSVRDIIDRSEK